MNVELTKQEYLLLREALRTHETFVGGNQNKGPEREKARQDKLAEIDALIRKLGEAHNIG